MMNVVEKGVKFDGEKPQWGLLPFKQVEQVVDVLTFGAKKYSPDNWKKVPDAERRYFDAMMRHIAQYKYDDKLDDETGKSHLAHAICCALFLMGFDDGEGIELDENDMPIKTGEVKVEDLINEGGTQFDLKPSDIFPFKPNPGFNPMDSVNKLAEQHNRENHYFIGNNAKVSPHKCTLETGAINEVAVDKEPPMTDIECVLHNLEHNLENGRQFIDTEFIKTLNDGGQVFSYTGNLAEPFEYVIYEHDETKPLVSLYE